MRGILSAALLVAAVAVAGPARAAPVSEDAFLARNTGDLVVLCGADRTDPLYTAAQNFCHGFAVGTYRTLVQVQQAMRLKKKLFCLPDKPPARNETIAEFVAWAGTHNEMMALPPIDGIVRFLSQQFPCE